MSENTNDNSVVCYTSKKLEEVLNEIGIVKFLETHSYKLYFYQSLTDKQASQLQQALDNANWIVSKTTSGSMESDTWFTSREYKSSDFGAILEPKNANIECSNRKEFIYSQNRILIESLRSSGLYSPVEKNKFPTKNCEVNYEVLSDHLFHVAPVEFSEIYIGWGIRPRQNVLDDTHSARIYLVKSLEFARQLIEHMSNYSNRDISDFRVWFVEKTYFGPERRLLVDGNSKLELLYTEDWISRYHTFPYYI